MKSIKSNIFSIFLVFSAILFSFVYFSNKHDRQLLEVARVHQFIGCMQVTNKNAILCSKLVSITPQVSIIKDVLDSKVDDGKLIMSIIQESENSTEPKTETINGNSN